MVFYRRLSSEGLGALSIWEFNGDPKQLIELIECRIPAVSDFCLVELRDSLGKVFDQALLWRRSEQHFELHIHGGFGVASALQARLDNLAWQPREQLLMDNSVISANSILQARCWSSGKFVDQLCRWEKKTKAAEIVRLRELYEWSEVLLDMPKVVLAGPPNAGKSSLFNAWVQEQRCTVSPHPGTTRDSIAATIMMGQGLDSFLLSLIDTAGMGQSADKLDELSQQRTVHELTSAWRVVYVFDAAEKPSADLLTKFDGDSRGIAFVNQCDLQPNWEWPTAWLSGSLQEHSAQVVEQISRALLASMPMPPQSGTVLPSSFGELEQMRRLIN